MPIDALDRNEVVAKIRSAASASGPFLLSTPNVNFLVISQRDSGFRDSLLRSDLCPADGMPIVWLARMLGIPLKQRVSGSDIFDVLRSCGPASQPFKVFLFGGSDGVAETVCELLNRRSTGMRCVGWLNPGFGTIEEMSTQKIIQTVNESNADLLAVFLSAKKAQSPVALRNHNRLSVPTRGQFGATINYQAGTVQRGSPYYFPAVGVRVALAHQRRAIPLAPLFSGWVLIGADGYKPGFAHRIEPQMASLQNSKQARRTSYQTGASRGYRSKSHRICD